MTRLPRVRVQIGFFCLIVTATVRAEEPFAGSACTLMGASNCQLPAGDVDPGWGSGHLSDLTIGPHGVVSADDFVPQASTLTQVCVWGFYHDTTLRGPESNLECIDAVRDEFRVRIFTDDNGLPGVLLGETLVTGANIQRGPVSSTGFVNMFADSTNAIPHGYTLTLDSPIIDMVPGQRHWLEVANNTRGLTDSARTCWWNWLQHYPPAGDGYSVSGANSGGVEDPRKYLFNESRYIHGSARMSDLAFCLGTTDGPLAFDSGSPVTAACWTCGGVEAPACSVTTALGCVSDLGVRGIWNRLDPNCSGSFDDVGGRIDGDFCDESEGGARFISEGLHALDTRCASGSGSINTLDAGNLEVGNDLWFHYTTTCTGWVNVNGCVTQPGITQNGFDLSDPGIALYRDPLDPSVCVCPGSGVEPIRAATESCNGLPDAGSAVLESITFPGECWTIRVADFVGAGSVTNAGPVLLDIECTGAPCYLAFPPDAERIGDEFGMLQSNLKNRYLSIASVDEGREQALRVEFVDLPSPYDIWNGSKLWVAAPTSIGASGSAQEGLDGAIHVAPLACLEHPFATDWNALGVVHVYHEGIVPGGVYEIQALDTTANPAFERCYSEPLVMTTAGLGDTTGGCTTSLCFPVDGSVDIGDALAILGRFASAPGSIVLPRADLEPACVDFEINVSDVLLSLRGFTGQSYPFVPSAADPCDATCAIP